CPEGECPDLSDREAGKEELEVEPGELGCKIEIEASAGEEGTLKKKIAICPDGEFPDMGKVELEIDLDLDEAGLSGEKTTIKMVVDEDGEKVTIKARGDKEKLKPEIDEILEELKEDGGKVTTKELEDGYDITIEK
ncbi:MAG: hypothetical protein GY771_16555, partial [bacterium]|nr:hypothetical protein [bacterium]